MIRLTQFVNNEDDMTDTIVNNEDDMTDTIVNKKM